MQFQIKLSALTFLIFVGVLDGVPRNLRLAGVAGLLPKIISSAMVFDFAWCFEKRDN